MSTAARISIKENNGERKSIYLHWDGYIERAGIILQLAYNTEDRVRKLIDLGDLSVLGFYIEPKTAIHSFDTPDEDVCVAYHRDRGEELRFSDGRQHYNYVFDVTYGCWFVEDGHYSSDATKILELDDLLPTRTSLLLDEIMELEDVIYEYWCVGVIRDCIEKAKEAVHN